MYAEFNDWIKNGEFELPPLNQIKLEDFAYAFKENNDKKQIIIF